MTTDREALHSSESVEWYTPKKYVDAARGVMGNIDLDPASCEYANEKFVKADEFFDERDDGLDKKWWGRVYMNPPFGRNEAYKSNAKIWSEYLIEQFVKGRVEEAIMHVSAVPDRQWFQPLWNFYICFTDHRIQFKKHPNQEKKKQPTHGSAFVYMGDKIYNFKREFSKFGKIVRP